MSPERRSEIARMGGKSVPAAKRAYSQDTELAVAAGRKGGLSVNPAKRAFARDPELASKAGAKGGHASRGGGRPKEP
ncbi:KGG domain-containing protein [Methylocystis sp. IM2]